MARKSTVTVPPLSDLPAIGLLRLSQVLQFVPISASCWWQGIRNGTYPKPRKLSARVTVWDARDIRRLIEDTSNFRESSTDAPTLGQKD